MRVLTSQMTWEGKLGQHWQCTYIVASLPPSHVRMEKLKCVCVKGKLRTGIVLLIHVWCMQVCGDGWSSLSEHQVS